MVELSKSDLFALIVSDWVVLPVLLFIMLYKVVLTSASVDESLVCDHSNESYW